MDVNGYGWIRMDMGRCGWIWTDMDIDMWTYGYMDICVRVAVGPVFLKHTFSRIFHISQEIDQGDVLIQPWGCNTMKARYHNT